MARLVTPDCTGIELVDNVLVGGSGEFSQGLTRPALKSGNRTLPAGRIAPRPATDLPFIYLWQ